MQEMIVPQPDLVVSSMAGCWRRRGLSRRGRRPDRGFLFLSATWRSVNREWWNADIAANKTLVMVLFEATDTLTNLRRQTGEERLGSRVGVLQETPATHLALCPQLL